MHDKNVSKQWSHRAVYHAAKATSFHLLRTEPASQTRPIFTEHYKKLAFCVMRGEPLEPAPIFESHQIEYTKERLEKNVCLAHLAKMKEKMNG